MALGAAGSARADDVVDLGGETVTISTANGFSDYQGKIIQNGTINLTTKNQSGWTDGTYTIGSGAVVNCAMEFGLDVDNRVYTLNIKDGGAFTNTAAAAFMIPLRYATATLLLDNGTLASTQAYSDNYNRGPICIGYSWNNSDGAKDKVIDVKAILTNNSLLQVDTGKLQIGGARAANKNNKVSSVNIVFAVTNSTVNVKQGIIQIGAHFNPKDWISGTSGSKTEVVFGQGADVTCNQIYVYKSQTASILFDGATLRWAGSGNSFVGQNSSVSGDIYTIGEGGLTIDIPSGKSLGIDGNSSALTGTGGITKIGDGSITWNSITPSGSKKHLFTGPLVVSNGTWTSTLGYAASAFKVDGANSTLELSGALSATDVAFEATDGGTLTLAGATIADTTPDLTLAGGGTTDYFIRDGEVETYTLDSITLGPGAVLDLDADATGADVITATTTNITATAAEPVTVNLNFLAAPAAGQSFTLFETDDAAKFMVNPKLGSLTVPYEMSVVDGHLVMTVTADDYVWNGTQTNWGDADAWRKGGANATWSDGNNAIFNTENATAVLAANAVASKVEFTADATVSGSATLTAPSVSVAADVAGTISAPTAGSLTKTGAGTLVLGSSRTEQTTVSEGTLKVASGETVDPANLTLGTDAAKPVTFDYDGKTLTASPTTYLGAGMDVTLTNGVYACTSDLLFSGDALPSVLTIAKDAVFSTSSRANINTSEEKTIKVDGGEVDFTPTSGSEKNAWFMQSSSGHLRIEVSNGGVAKSHGYLLCATGHNSANLSPKLEFVFNDSTLVTTGHGLFLGNRGSQKVFTNYPDTPECRLSMTNSVFYTEQGFILGQLVTENTSKRDGYYIAEFDHCTVTSKFCKVNGDRTNSAIYFNATRLVSNGDGANWIQESDFAEGATPVTVGSGGLVLDTNGKTMTLLANLAGSGAVTKTGDGKLTIAKSQTSSAAFVCESGEVMINGGLTVNRPATVKDGATLTIKAIAQSTFAGLTLESGAILNIDTYTVGVTPFAASALALPASPASGTVSLALDGGAFPIGRYAILEKTGITAADVEGKLVPSVSAGSTSWEVSGDTLYLVVKGANDFIWTGVGSDAKFSNGANWQGGSRPESGANVIIALGTAGTIECDVADFAPASITFPAGSAAVTIAGENAITGVAAVTNLSDSSHTISVPVYFAGDIQVKQNADHYDNISLSHVTFAGGAYAAEGYSIDTGATVVWSRCMFGEYFLRNAESAPWTAVNYSSCRPAVAENSTLHVPYAGALTELYVGNNARVDVGEMTLSAEKERVSYRNYGEVAVTNLVLTGTGDRFLTHNQGTSDPGVFKFNSVTNKMATNWFYFSDDAAAAAASHTIYIGADGLNFDSASTSCYSLGQDASGNTVTIRPWYSDFTIGARATDVYGLALNRNVTICTDDENDDGRTITINAKTRGRGTDPVVTISGSGTVVKNGGYNNATAASPTVAVTDTATLALKPGAGFGEKLIAVAAGATLEVAESGKVELGGDLSLADGAILKFNFTERRTAPVLDLTDRAVTFGDQTNIVVSLSGDVRPSGQTVVLTSGSLFAKSDVTITNGDYPNWVESVYVGDDNDIYAKIKPVPMMVIVR